MKNFLTKFFLSLIVLLSFTSATAVCVDDSTSAVDSTTTGLSNLDSTALLPGLQMLHQTFVMKPFFSDKYGLTLKQTLKYDTTWDNPENRCYEFKKPLSPKYLFLFKFLSKKQYNVYSSP